MPKCYVKKGARDVDRVRARVCRDLSASHNFRGKSYCVLHFPNKSKSKNTDFDAVVTQRLRIGEYDFRYVVFSSQLTLEGRDFAREAVFTECVFYEGVNIRNCRFNAEARFGSCTVDGSFIVNGCEFKNDFSLVRTKINGISYFTETVFKRCFFIECHFGNDARFRRTVFTDMSRFLSTRFSGSADFMRAQFLEDAIGEFSGATFEKQVDLYLATLEGQLLFIGGRRRMFGHESSLSLDLVRTKSGDNITFMDVRLRPHWFLRCEATKFRFANVKWENGTGATMSTFREADAAHGRIRALTITCRQLAENFETARDFEQASCFRRMEMNLLFVLKLTSFLARVALPGLYVAKFLRVRPRQTNLRKQIALWTRRRESFSFSQSLDPPHYLYRILSFYGESWARAAVVLVSLWFGFGVIFWSAGVGAEKVQTFVEALGYSSLVGLLQKPEPRPLEVIPFSAYIAEMVIMPVQAALLALALRRKFMR